MAVWDRTFNPFRRMHSELEKDMYLTRDYGFAQYLRGMVAQVRETGRPSLVYVKGKWDQGLSEFISFEVPRAAGNVEDALCIGQVNRYSSNDEGLLDQVFHQKILGRLLNRGIEPVPYETMSDATALESLDPMKGPSKEMYWLTPGQQRDMAWARYRASSGVIFRELGVGLPVSCSNIPSARLKNVRRPRPIVRKLLDLDDENEMSQNLDYMGQLSDIVSRLGMVLCVSGMFFYMPKSDVKLRDMMVQYMQQYSALGRVLVVLGISRNPPLYRERAHLPYDVDIYRLKKPGKEYIAEALKKRQAIEKRDIYSEEALLDIASASGGSIDKALSLARGILGGAHRGPDDRPIDRAYVRAHLKGAKKEAAN